MLSLACGLFVGIGNEAPGRGILIVTDNSKEPLNMVEWLPGWLETFRILGTFLIWAILPCQVYMLWRSVKQYGKWEADETRRLARWQRDMEDAGKLREEAYHLRAQAEVALAQARRHLPANDRAKNP